MSLSFYSKLQRYAARPERSQLENFLTEALVDIVNRLSLCDQLEILSMLAGSVEKVPDKLHWKTQFSIRVGSSTKYPDIAVLAPEDGNRVVALIEVKVAAGFTSHITTCDDSDEQQVISQLEVYRNWLSDEAGSLALDDASLGLLKRWTTISPDEKSRINCRVSRWQDIYFFFERLTEIKVLEPEVAFLISQFVKFLDEQNMSEQSATYEDFAIASVFVGGPQQRLDSSIEAVFLQLKHFDYRKRKTSKVDYDDGGAVMWSWIYPFEKEVNIYFGWGYFFPQKEGWWRGPHNNAIPVHDSQAFFIVGTDDADESAEQQLLQKFEKNGGDKNWCWPTAENSTDNLDIKCFTPIAVLLRDGDFDAAFARWVRAKFDFAHGIFK